MKEMLAELKKLLREMQTLDEKVPEPYVERAQRAATVANNIEKHAKRYGLYE